MFSFTSVSAFSSHLLADMIRLHILRVNFDITLISNTSRRDGDSMQLKVMTMTMRLRQVVVIFKNKLKTAGTTNV